MKVRCSVTRRGRGGLNLSIITHGSVFLVCASPSRNLRCSVETWCMPGRFEEKRRSGSSHVAVAWFGTSHDPTSYAACLHLDGHPLAVRILSPRGRPREMKENKTRFRAAAVLDPHQGGLPSFSIILSPSSSSVLGTLSGWISRSRCTFGLRVNNCGSGLPFSWRLLGLRHSLDCLLLRSDPAERL